jgi:murein DD-endopeptidase MepM/ murein hydrolase activator NlpD
LLLKNRKGRKKISLIASQIILINGGFSSKICFMNVSNFLNNSCLVIIAVALPGCMLFKQISEFNSTKPEPVKGESGLAVVVPVVANLAPVPIVVTSTPVTTLNWLWPADGKVITKFDGRNMKGINLQGAAGDPVYAVADGVIVYIGNGFKQPGKFIIIKHDNVYLTAYAHNRKTLVKENEKVSQGQKIAEMGNSATKYAKLYFEVREVGKTVDPLNYLHNR